jgi:methanogenic corrinoid protein MtbC1
VKNSIGKHTPKNIQFMGRDPKHDMELGGIRDDYIVLVGGAPLNEEFGDAIGADAYCRDAATAVDVAKELVASAS